MNTKSITNADLFKALAGILPYAECEAEQLHEMERKELDEKYKEEAEAAAAAVEFAQGVLKSYKEQNP